MKNHTNIFTKLSTRIFRNEIIHDDTVSLYSQAKSLINISLNLSVFTSCSRKKPIVMMAVHDTKSYGHVKNCEQKREVANFIVSFLLSILLKA